MRFYHSYDNNQCYIINIINDRYNQCQLICGRGSLVQSQAATPVSQHKGHAVMHSAAAVYFVFIAKQSSWRLR